MKNQDFVPSVYSSLEIMEWLSIEKNKASTLTEISKGLEINKSTCLRILKTLTMKGYIVYSENTKKYSLGYSLIPLGTRAQEVNDYIKKIITYLPKVSEDTGLTIVLVKKVNNQLMYLAKQEPRHMVRLTVSVGEAFPIHAGALGKCFLAFMESESRQEVIKNLTKDGQLPKYTENSLVDPVNLMKQIEYIRHQGIAQSDGEYNAGISAFACPIFDSNHNIILVLGGFMPSPMINHVEIEDVRKKMVSYAHEMTQSISRF